MESKIDSIYRKIGGSPYIQITKLEADFICRWLKNLRCNTLLELGTAYGGSALLIKTIIPTIKLITFDINIDKADYIKIQKNWPTKSNIGILLPKDVKLELGDIRKDLPNLINKYKPDIIFHDDGHTPNIIQTNIKQCYYGDIKYVIVHDSHKQHMRDYFIDNPYYDEVEYYMDSRGVSILRRKEYND